MDNNTRRYPRTLEQAFGPYAGNHIEPMQTDSEFKSWFIWAAAVGVSVMGFLVLVATKKIEVGLAIFSFVLNGAFVIGILVAFVFVMDLVGSKLLKSIDWIKDGGEFF